MPVFIIQDPEHLNHSNTNQINQLSQRILMKTSTACNVIAQLALAGALIALAGCKSSGNYEKGAATGAGLVQAAAKIEQGITNIDAVLTSMNNLTTSSPGDLTPKYKQFTTDVGKLKESAENVKERVADMRENGNA